MGAKSMRMPQYSGMCTFTFASINRLRAAVLLCALTMLNSLLIVGCGNQEGEKVTRAESGNTTSIVTQSESAGKARPGPQQSPLVSTNLMRSFLARGVIRSVGADSRTLVVRHEDIPGFMPRMTMEFNVRNTNEVQGLGAGEVITFNVNATEEDSWIEDIRRVGTNDLATLRPSDPSSASLLHVAQMKPGDVLPDAELLSEDGRTIKLSGFQGRALALTFIFTRCPLPDYCPRMNQHFSRARELLLAQPGGPTNWQFLSISFDPEFDQPGVLTRYAFSYRGPSTDRWLFAAAPTDVMASFAGQLDFRFANEGGSFLHNLRTVVLDPQRRIYRQFDGNKWKAQELAQALAEAAGGPRK